MNQDTYFIIPDEVFGGFLRELGNDCPLPGIWWAAHTKHQKHTDDIGAFKLRKMTEILVKRHFVELKCFEMCSIYI